jgi:cytochrome c oxidase accessory protein FixG
MLGFNDTREWVYPQSISGYFTTVRNWTFVGLHVILFVIPWINANGHPLLQFDLPARRFYVAGQILTASDTIFLLMLMLFLAFALFFVTSLWGRLWCGYACPQTVFLESWIRPLEQWIEGDRRTRMRRNQAGFSFDMAWRKVAKWAAFMAVSVLLSMAMVSYFAGARNLWTGNAGPVAYTFVAAFTFLWFWDFTWFREQFCNYLCPYARFQSALTDDESLIIHYDEVRGEPREKGKVAARDGRCIDCNKCVVVCPQGIDIRDGFQLECIQCARCIDACTSVMEPLGHETLVRYSTIAEEEGRKVRTIRPRTVIYGGILGGLVLATLTLMVGRVPFEASVNRAPGTLFSVDADGYVRNTYLLQITNKSAVTDSVSYRVQVEDFPEAEVLTSDVRIASTESLTVPLIIRVPVAANVPRTSHMHVRVISDLGELVLPTTFKTGADFGSAAGSSQD